MVKIQNISGIHPTLGFTEFDIQEKYRKSFHESELGRLYSVFLFERIAKEVGLSEHRLGRKGIFSPCVKIGLMVLKAYTGFSVRQLVEHLNGNIHYQMFCGHEAPLGKPRMPLKHICRHCSDLVIRRPRNKYTDVAASYLSYCKKRKRKASKIRMLKHCVCSSFLKSSSVKRMRSIGSAVLYSDIPRIVRNNFP